MKEKQLKDFQTRQISSVDICSQCDCGKKRIIVNKYFYLCEAKNRKRLQMQKLQVQGGKDKRPTEKVERKFSSIQKRPSKKNRSKRENKFHCSNGELVTQAEIKIRYKRACDEIDLEREQYCEATGRTDLPLSHSHTISQRRCKHLRKTELIWDKDNIFLESMGASDSGHVTWEHGSLEDKKKLLNFERKLAYIKIHDQETYQKIINEL